jgi:DNA-binding NarL/FixJ family response regulator
MATFPVKADSGRTQQALTKPGVERVRRDAGGRRTPLRAVPRVGPARRGAAGGYLAKEAAPHELVAAIRQVARGAKYISPSLATAPAEQLGDREGAPREILSDLELQVLRLLASGKRISDIAQDLSLSVKILSTYRTRILTKLNLESSADLIRYALEHGLGN